MYKYMQLYDLLEKNTTIIDCDIHLSIFTVTFTRYLTAKFFIQHLHSVTYTCFNELRE
jgi:hypothetical protein